MTNTELKKKQQKLNFKISILSDTIREQKVELKDNESLLESLLIERNNLGE